MKMVDFMTHNFQKLRFKKSVIVYAPAEISKKIKENWKWKYPSFGEQPRLNK